MPNDEMVKSLKVENEVPPNQRNYKYSIRTNTHSNFSIHLSSSTALHKSLGHVSLHWNQEWMSSQLCSGPIATVDSDGVALCISELRAAPKAKVWLGITAVT